LGPLIGVFIDIGLLESVRFLSEYRMILFGGLVAAILIIFPEGIISPRLVSRIKRKLVKKNNA
jgi:branched-chain amino acid transport system permease protein